jgi:hypothetical protein
VLHNLHVANDGEAALAFLHDVEYGRAPRPAARCSKRSNPTRHLRASRSSC